MVPGLLLREGTVHPSRLIGRALIRCFRSPSARVKFLPAPFGGFTASRVVHDPPEAQADSFERTGWMDQPLQRKERTMSNTQTHKRPLYRVSFARITGKDENGQDIVGRPKEIGAVWPRNGGKSGGILALDIIPVELTQRQGVIFLVPVNGKGGAQ